MGTVHSLRPSLRSLARLSTSDEKNKNNQNINKWMRTIPLPKVNISTTILVILLSRLTPRNDVFVDSCHCCISKSESEEKISVLVLLFLDQFCCSLLFVFLQFFYWFDHDGGRPPSTASVQSCGLAARWMSSVGDGVWSLAFHSVTRATCGSALAIKASSAHVHCMTRQMNPFFFLPHFPDYIFSIWPLSFNHISEDAFFFSWWISLLSRVRRILPFLRIKCFL